MASMVTDFLWGSTPTITSLMPSPRLEHQPVGEGGQSYLEPGSPLSGHDLTSGARPERSPIKEPQPQGWAAARRASSRAPRQQPGRAAAVGEALSSRERAREGVTQGGRAHVTFDDGQWVAAT